MSAIPGRWSRPIRSGDLAIRRAQVVRGLVTEDYGSGGFTVRDPEGTLWSFGAYEGA